MLKSKSLKWNASVLSLVTVGAIAGALSQAFAGGVEPSVAQLQATQDSPELRDLVIQAGRDAYSAIQVIASCDGEDGQVKNSTEIARARLLSLKKEFEGAKSAAIAYLRFATKADPSYVIRSVGEMKLVVGINKSGGVDLDQAERALKKAKIHSAAISKGLNDYGNSYELKLVTEPDCDPTIASCEARVVNQSPANELEAKKAAFAALKRVEGSAKRASATIRCARAEQTMASIAQKAVELRGVLGDLDGLPPSMAIETEGLRSDLSADGQPAYLIEGQRVKSLADINSSMQHILPNVIEREADLRPGFERGVMMQAIAEFYAHAETDFEGRLSENGRQEFAGFAASLLASLDARTHGEYVREEWDEARAKILEAQGIPKLIADFKAAQEAKAAKAAKSAGASAKDSETTESDVYPSSSPLRSGGPSDLYEE